jgi:hypothetical protein
MHSELGLDICREDEDAEAATRRETLSRLGRFAYVAPALALLTEPDRAEGAYGETRREPVRDRVDAIRDRVGLRP